MAAGSQPLPPPPPMPYSGVTQGPPLTYVPPPPQTPKSHVALYVAVAVVAVVVIGGIAAALVFAAANSPNSRVTISGINWTIDYTGTTSGYFGSPTSNGCGNCPITEPTGSSFVYSWTLQSSAFAFSHNIDVVSVQGPFSISSISPALPVTVAPGGTVTLSITIHTPSAGGGYTIDGTLTTN